MSGTSAPAEMWCKSSNRRRSAQGEQSEFSRPSRQARGGRENSDCSPCADRRRLLDLHHISAGADVPLIFHNPTIRSAIVGFVSRIGSEIPAWLCRYSRTVGGSIR